MAKPIYRYFEFDRAKIKDEDRTVEVCFSSEHAVDRGDFDEILDHSKEGMDLSRVKDKHPFLLNHDPDKLVGVIEHAELSDDKRGRAVIRFGDSDLANQIYKDVKNGIRPHISVGYERLRTISSEKTEGGRSKIRFAWRPFEISSVPVPADETVGVGRNAETPPDAESIRKSLVELEKTSTELRQKIQELQEALNRILAKAVKSTQRTTGQDLIAAGEAGHVPPAGRDEQGVLEGEEQVDVNGKEDEDAITAEGQNGGTVVDPDPRCRIVLPTPPISQPELRCRVDA